MPNFQISNAPPPTKQKVKRITLSKAKVDKSIKAHNRNIKHQIANVSGYNSTLGSDDYKELSKAPDIVLEFKYLSLDHIHISHDGKWGIKYITKKSYEDKTEHYDLIRFLKPIDITKIDEIQQIYHYANDTLVYPIVETDDDLVLRKMTDIICKTITDDRHCKIDRELGVNNNVKKFESKSSIEDNGFSITTQEDIQTKVEVLQKERQEVSSISLSTEERTERLGEEKTEIIRTERKRLIIDL